MRSIIPQPPRLWHLLALSIAAAFVLAPTATSTATRPGSRATRSALFVLHGRTLPALKGVGNQSLKGCRFSFSSALRPGEMKSTLHSTSINISTCEMRGKVTTVGVASQHATLFTRQPGRDSLPGCPCYSAGTQNDWVTDIANIEVNRVRSYLDWYWNGVSNFNATCHGLDTRASWWTLATIGTDYCYAQSSTYFRGEVDGVAFTYGPGVFCPFGTTYVYYNNIWITGSNHGDLAGGGTVSIYEPGNCIGLNMNHDLERRA
jgi:hypothetical protein